MLLCYNIIVLLVCELKFGSSNKINEIRTNTFPKTNKQTRKTGFFQNKRHTGRPPAVMEKTAEQEADVQTVRKTKPHRTASSPALCGLKLLCELSQARAGKKEQKERKEKEDSISKVRLLLF